MLKRLLQGLSSWLNKIAAEEERPRLNGVYEVTRQWTDDAGVIRVNVAMADETREAVSNIPVRQVPAHPFICFTMNMGGRWETCSAV